MSDAQKISKKILKPTSAGLLKFIWFFKKSWM